MSSRVRQYFDCLQARESNVWYPTAYSWRLADFLALMSLSDHSVLDVGCGAGNLALFAAECGAKVSASDISEEAIEATTRHSRVLKLPLRALRSDGLQFWVEAGEKFDVIVCNPPSVELLSEGSTPSSNPFFNSYMILDLLDNYRRVLKPHGCLLSVVSGRGNIERVDAMLDLGDNMRSFFLHKRVLAEGPMPENVSALLDDDLLQRDNEKLFWNAFYFGVFSF